MIEKTICDYLNSMLKVPSYMEIPHNPPAKYILIEKTDGNMEEHIFHSTFALQSYADSMLDAAMLNATLIDVMKGIISLSDIAKVELNSNYNFTDTETKKYRYQAVFDITHY